MATNVELWAYIEIMWIKRHIVPFFIYSHKLSNTGTQGNIFYVYPYLIICNYEKGITWIKICIVPFYSYQLSNMGIQGNENSFFTWDFKVGSDDSLSYYSNNS